MHPTLKTTIVAAISATALSSAVGLAGAATGDPAASEYWGTCPGFPTGVTADAPVSLSPGPADANWPIPTPTNVGYQGIDPSVTGIHVDGPSLTMSSYQRNADDGSTSAQFTCKANGHLTNTLTVGAGTSGLATGDPVKVALITQLDGTLGYVATSGSFTSDSNATVKFAVTDPNNYGHSVASYVADGYLETDAASGDPTTGAGGFVEEMYKTDLYLNSNAAPSVSETPAETYIRPTSSWPTGSGVGGAPVDFGNSIGTRTITFATTVGATLDIDGSLSTLEAVSNGVTAATSDFSNGFSAGFGADPANPGISLTLATDPPASVPTSLVFAPVKSTYVFGEPVHVDVCVWADHAVPTGALTAGEGGTTLDTENLDSLGCTTLTLTGLSIDSHVLWFSYPGAPGFGVSSGTMALDVTRDATTTVLSVQPAKVKPASPVRLVADVSTNAPGVGTPTGTVTFYDGSKVLGSAVLTSGEAVLSLPGKPLVGKHTISAAYTGDTTHNGSSAQLTIKG